MATVLDVAADVGVADVVNVVLVLWVWLSILLMDSVRHLSVNTMVVITRNKCVMLLIAFIQRYSPLSSILTVHIVRNEHGQITHCPQ